MASRPSGYGLTAELTAQRDKKWDSTLADDAFNWIRKITGQSLPKPSSQNAVQEALKDGVALCKLANAIKPGSVARIGTSKMPFKMMENIGNFLQFCEKIGLARTDLFQTVDLFEGQNIPQVINTIHALGRKVRTINPSLPGLGPKEADKKPRSFTEEQKKSGAGVIGLQMGTNKGATQTGINFGLGRQIV